MASLALLVTIIFLIALLIGPLALLAKYFKLKLISKILGILAIASGVYWLTATIFPISMVGFIGIVCGIKIFYKKPKLGKSEIKETKLNN